MHTSVLSPSVDVTPTPVSSPPVPTSPAPLSVSLTPPSVPTSPCRPSISPTPLSVPVIPVVPITPAPALLRRLVGGKWLRCGYTTGTCAAGAAKAAALMLLSGGPVPTVTVNTPGGILVTLDVLDPVIEGAVASCAIRKEAGDDPDSTDGALIYAQVERIANTRCASGAARATDERDATGGGTDGSDVAVGRGVDESDSAGGRGAVGRDATGVVDAPPMVVDAPPIEAMSDDEIIIDGGEGIGRVTKPGLDQPVGAAAINTVPRRMIRDAVLEAQRKSACQTFNGIGWRVTVSCPAGERIAAKTFNPKLGIEGGISILGTTGIVEPMSNAALVETMAREISILAAQGMKDLLVVIGNYGESFARENLGLIVDGPPTYKSAMASLGGNPASLPPGDSTPGNPSFVNLPLTGADTEHPPYIPVYGVVKSSNFIGDAIAQAAEHGIERVLIVGHLGKLVKVGIGMLNTHSNQGDGRIETLIACALRAGAGMETLHALQDCVSTDAAVAVLLGAGLLQETMEQLSIRIQGTFERHVPAGMDVEWICFTRLGADFTPIAHSPGSKTLIQRWYCAPSMSTAPGPRTSMDFDPGIVAGMATAPAMGIGAGVSTAPGMGICSGMAITPDPGTGTGNPYVQCDHSLPED